MSSLLAIQKDIRHLGVIVEDVRDQNDKILELVSMMVPLVAHIPKIESHLAEMKIDMKAVKQAVRATHEDVMDHERRITALEKR